MESTGTECPAITCTSTLRHRGAQQMDILCRISQQVCRQSRQKHTGMEHPVCSILYAVRVARATSRTQQFRTGVSYPSDAPQGAGAGWNAPQEQGCPPDVPQPQEAQALRFLQSLLLAPNPQHHPAGSEYNVTHPHTCSAAKDSTMLHSTAAYK